MRNTGSDCAAWWHGHGFAWLAALEDFARQMASRPVDVAWYATLNGRRWDAAFIDNANAETARRRAEFAERFVDAQGKGAIVDACIALVGQWVKGGKYTTCFVDPNDLAACGPTVHVGAIAGLMRLPIRSAPYTAFRVHACGSAIPDMPCSAD